MAVRGTADAKPYKWSFSSRWIDEIPQRRARLRTTLMRAVTPDFQVGVEFNPLKEEVGPLANWRVLPESGWQPALIVGTSSDRIGTPRGQAFYGTLSKNIQKETGLPIAPYMGGSYGTYKDRFDPIGGMNVFWTNRVSTMHLFDGVSFHHILNVAVDNRFSFGLLCVTQKRDKGDPYYGMTYGFRF